MAATSAPDVSTQDPWVLLASPFSRSDLEWRADGKVTNSGTVRMVPFVSAQTVAKRLDSVEKGWDLDTEALPIAGTAFTCRASLMILNTTRDGIGQGTDYKGAASDAFKRAAERFGVASYLYGTGNVYVKVKDPTAKYPQPAQDPYDVWQAQLTLVPSVAWCRSVARATAAQPVQPLPASFTASDDGLLDPEPVTTANMGKMHPDDATCPKCGNGVWDNREGKRNPKSPDFKCKDKGCDGCIWPPKTAKGETDPYLPAGAPRPAAAVPAHIVAGLDLEDEELPF